MTSSINKAILLGNVGADPDIRTTNDGREMSTLSIATTEQWKDKNTSERRERTEWHKVVIFQEGLVRVVKNYVKKGSKLYIEGQIQTRKWQENSDSEKKYVTEIVLQGPHANIVILDSRGGGNNRTSGFEQGNEHYNNNNSNNGPQRNNMHNSDNFQHSVIDDEIPF